MVTVFFPVGSVFGVGIFKPRFGFGFRFFFQIKTVFLHYRVQDRPQECLCASDSIRFDFIARKLSFYYVTVTIGAKAEQETTITRVADIS